MFCIERIAIGTVYLRITNGIVHPLPVTFAGRAEWNDGRRSFCAYEQTTRKFQSTAEQTYLVGKALRQGDDDANPPTFQHRYIFKVS